MKAYASTHSSPSLPLTDFLSQHLMEAKLKQLKAKKDEEERRKKEKKAAAAMAEQNKAAAAAQAAKAVQDGGQVQVQGAVHMAQPRNPGSNFSRDPPVRYLDSRDPPMLQQGGAPPSRRTPPHESRASVDSAQGRGGYGQGMRPAAIKVDVRASEPHFAPPLFAPPPHPPPHRLQVVASPLSAMSYAGPDEVCVCARAMGLGVGGGMLGR